MAKVKTIINNPMEEIHEEYVTIDLEDLKRDVDEDVYGSHHTELGSSSGWIRVGDLLIKQQKILQQRKEP